ncbi:MAG: hypothetical protein P8X50_08395 [Maritimibacter sp.]
MSKTTRRDEQDPTPEMMLKMAEDQVDWGLRKLKDAVTETAEHGGGDKKVGDAVNDMRKAIQTLFIERDRFEKLHPTGTDGVGIDLDAARAEIGRRLDRLREQSGTGEVSAKPE